MKTGLSKLFTSLAIACILSIPSLVLADGVCDPMKIQHIGTSAAAPSGVEIWLKNESGKTCGGGTIGTVNPNQFWLSTTNTDRTLAIILTAASLRKNLWVYVSGNAPPYIISFVQVKNISD